jgi:hypothetical protein
MGHDDHQEKELEQLIRNAAWEDLTPRLLLIICDKLPYYGDSPEKRRLESVAGAYARRTGNEILTRGAEHARRHRWTSLFGLLAAVAIELIEDDEQELIEKLKTTNWDDLIKRLLAYTVKHHRSTLAAQGVTPEERVQEAVAEHLMTRQRHWPHYEGVSLFQFLAGVIRSLTSHQGRKNKKKKGTIEEPLRLVSAAPGKLAAGEFSETGLASSEYDQKAEEIAGRKTDLLLSMLDDELHDYVLYRMDHEGLTAAQYAKALNVTTQRIRNMDRRLKRARSRWGMETDVRPALRPRRPTA